MWQRLNILQKQALAEYLSSFVTEERNKRFEEVLNFRINHMHIVLEDVYQAHNASAVLRSADCFGIQNVHFIENKNKYKVSDEVALGSSQWLSIERHKDSKEALTKLKQQGFKIVATSPRKNDKTIYDFDVTQKFALVFGTEIDGISQDVLSLSDEFVKIPMYGFTESFNISVCAALCMHEFSNKIRDKIKNPFLSPAEKQNSYLDWLMKSIKKPGFIVKDFIEKLPDLSDK